MRDENLCPNCNGPMISRNGKYGIFWGCKDYPRCNGTRDSLGRSKADRAREKGEEVSDEIIEEFKNKEWNANMRDKITFNKKR